MYTCFHCANKIETEAGGCISCIDHMCTNAGCTRIRFSPHKPELCFICLAQCSIENMDEGQTELVSLVVNSLTEDDELIDFMPVFPFPKENFHYYNAKPYFFK